MWSGKSQRILRWIDSSVNGSVLPPMQSNLKAFADGLKSGPLCLCAAWELSCCASVLYMRLDKSHNGLAEGYWILLLSTSLPHAIVGCASIRQRCAHPVLRPNCFHIRCRMNQQNLRFGAIVALPHTSAPHSLKRLDSSTSLRCLPFQPDFRLLFVLLWSSFPFNLTEILGSFAQANMFDASDVGDVNTLLIHSYSSIRSLFLGSIVSIQVASILNGSHDNCCLLYFPRFFPCVTRTIPTLHPYLFQVGR